MKLLFCTSCEDLFRLTEQDRKCSCGKIGGKYINESEAEIFGKEAVSVAFGNGSFWGAILALAHPPSDYRTRQDWQTKNSFMAWVRPNEGLGNPHTVVKEKVSA